jgi:hypothetical protein
MPEGNRKVEAGTPLLALPYNFGHTLSDVPDASRD